jgi:hypothetical protein
VIFFHTDGDELCAVSDILEFFGHASGLGTNFTKCSVSPVSCSEEKAARAVVVMECELAPCPFKFLGIPLAIIRLPCSAYQPVIDRIADKLPTWKASMMPRAGRPALIKSVLAAIPLHQLIVLSLNKNALKQVNKILRSFLWVGRKDAKGRQCHVNWDKVARLLWYGARGNPTSPSHSAIRKQVNKILRGFLWVGRKDAKGGQCHANWGKVATLLWYGGLGIPDLTRTAISLWVRWLWRMRTYPSRPWRGLDM